ncbi:cytochrome P450 [Nemania sp. FL0031]|nr:cytochrome P450 [Nemania sp. FL0031]
MWEDFANSSWATSLVGVLLATLLYYWLAIPIYNVWLHPLSKYPGPPIWAMSQIPWTVMFCSGEAHRRLLELHDQYGPIVRIGPNELSYTEPGAWGDIVGRRKSGPPENPKAPWYCPPESKHIAVAPYEDHLRMRRVLSAAFSGSALVKQEKLVMGYVNLLMHRLYELSANEATSIIDIGLWFNFCLFDTIGDLAFGEPFGCLQESAIHPWIAMIFATLRAGAVGTALSRFPLLRVLLPLVVPRKLLELGGNLKRTSKEKISKRMESKTTRSYFVEAMSSSVGDMSMTREEIDNNAFVLTVAGSETTATALTGATYLLVTNPDSLRKLYSELRDAFSDDRSIDFASVRNLRFLDAVTNESLRIYPPGVNAQPRIAPPGGSIIVGKHVPENTFLGIPQRAMYLSESNFKRAREFVPERWLDLAEFAADRRDCFHPFSLGSRNCIGMALATAQFKVLLARLVWNFDIQIEEDSMNWMEKQKSYLHWDKTSLYERLFPRPVQKSSCD